MLTNLISIIIPVYNRQDSIKECIKSLKNQTYPFRRMEIILINDGSTDDSGQLCKEIAGRNRNVCYIEQENRGVSAARNAGIKIATGKYIFYLDADDVLTKNTIKDCVRQFDKFYRKTDLLTYPIETHYQGRVLESHFRYQYLIKNKVYDLRSNAFIGQTTMNIVVKNRFEENVLFDETLSFSEDQKYCWDVAKRYLTMGFCKTAKYIYNRDDESSSGKLSGACYIFEPILKMFEDLFAEYEYVPMAFQGLFVNDIYWKMRSNIYFPYHYETERYVQAMVRVKKLLKKCYNSVIMDHPQIDYFEKFYLMRLKGSNTIQTESLPGKIKMYSEGHLVFQAESMEMVITRIRVKEYKVRILGFLKSSFFQFYQGNITLTAIENQNRHKIMELSPSVHNYYLSHEPTQCFWRMEYECDVREVRELKFEVGLESIVLPVSYYFMPLVPFSKQYQYEHYEKDYVQIDLKQGQWNFGCKESEEKSRIWLYYDCKGVERDNGLEQFLYDSKKKDGVKRYYVITDDRQRSHLSIEHDVVIFGTDIHKELLLQTEKIITAFIEDNNILPVPATDYEKYANQFRFETIYLQHGVLHIDMPWKYSPEKILADKVVVSADVDTELLLKNGFQEEDLWKVKMPRFDLLPEKSLRKKKILFAPSWRSYLVGANIDNRWKLLEKKLTASHYFVGIQEFLESKRLQELLEKNDYILDVKLHPIFAQYEHLFEIKNERVNMKSEVKIEDYSLFVTDFSSFMFDFLYMDVPVLSFIPDFDEFMCGMNGYRKVDFMDKVQKKEVSKTSEEIVDKIEVFFESGFGMPYQVSFYGEKNGGAREAIYWKLFQ